MATEQLTDCRILIIDDTHANVLFLEGILQQGNFTQVRSVLDAREALRAFTEFQPDLVLLDLMMPHLDGFAVMEQLCTLLADKPYLPIVILTADIRPEAKRRALASGAADFLTKPLDAIEVLLRVKNHLEIRLLYLQQQQRADERIKEQAALIDRASDAIFVLDLQATITFWNRGAQTIFGWTPEEAVGRSLPALLGVDVPVLEHGQWSGELCPSDKNGKRLTVASRWTQMTDVAGRPKASLVICTDITEMKELEAHLQRVQRLESIGLLAGGIAHDLNNMLAPILMAVDLLELSRSVPTSLVSTLRQSAQRGSALVQQVLTFARRADHRSEPVQPRHLVAEIAQFAQLTFPPSINVRVAVPADLWLVQADATQMHQVLMNLCVNARDAMPAGGDLTIAARNEDAGKRVIVSVQDTGTGIAPDILDKIFDPFFTTKEPGKGTGLGLAMVREIVHKLGGSVRVASEIGSGSCFEVEIPALAESAAPPAATPQPAWPTGNGELVLVVDDEAGLRRMVAMMLEATGYRVMTAQNGAEALALYEQHSYGISVVLTDITMPHLDGVTMIDALRKINPQIRVIVASGTPTNFPNVHATLRKPYSAPMLLVAIRNALAANPANGGG